MRCRRCRARCRVFATSRCRPIRARNRTKPRGNRDPGHADSIDPGVPGQYAGRNGEYIFGGYATQTQPFALSATGATYSGDQGQRQVQIAAGQTIPVGDNGAAVFNNIRTGMALSRDSRAPAIPAAGCWHHHGHNPAAYTGGTYALNFTAANTYEVRDSSNALVTSGSYTRRAGDRVRRRAGDAHRATGHGRPFSVAPSSNQSLFTTVQNLVTALQTTTGSTASQAKLNNLVNGAINNIDRALDTHRRYGRTSAGA